MTLDSQNSSAVNVVFIEIPGAIAKARALTGFVTGCLDQFCSACGIFPGRVVDLQRHTLLSEHRALILFEELERVFDYLQLPRLLSLRREEKTLVSRRSKGL